MQDAIEEQHDPGKVLLQLLSRFNIVKRSALTQLLTREEVDVKNANITKSLLDFIDELELKLKEQPIVPPGEITTPEPPVFEGKKQILLLYAIEDKAWLEKMNKHLFMLKRQGNLHFVDLHADTPLGLSNISEYQSKLIDVADAVLCLLTPNCLSFSVFPLIEKAAGNQKLIPIKLELVDVKDTVIDAIQGLPSGHKFVSEWPDENQAFVDVVSNLKKFFNK